MKHNYSSQEEIMGKAKEIIARDGLEHLSMRKLSSECYLALGTLYHYFPSKDDLILACMEDFWKSRFLAWFESDLSVSFYETFASFCDLASVTFAEFSKTFSGIKAFGAGGLVDKGKESQRRYLREIASRLIDCAYHDPSVKKEGFDEAFNLEGFVTLLLDAVVFSLVSHQNKKAFLLALVKRTLY